MNPRSPVSPTNPTPPRRASPPSPHTRRSPPRPAGSAAFPRHKSHAPPFRSIPTPPTLRSSPRQTPVSLCLDEAEYDGILPRPPPRGRTVHHLPRRRRCGDCGRELGPGGEQPPEPAGGGAAAEAARHRSGEALRHGADRAARAGKQRDQGGRRAAQRAGGGRREAALLRAGLGAPQRGGLLPGHADPGRGRGQRGVRHGGQRHVPARGRHDQRARRAGHAEHGQGRQGVVAHRAHGAGRVVPAVGGGVPGGAVAGGDEADAGLFVEHGVLPHGERVPVLRLRGQCGGHLARLRAVPPQRRRARLRERPQVLQPPGRAARRRVHGGGEARELQRREGGDLGDRVAVQGGRQGGRRPGRQRRRLQREPRPPRALRQRHHPAQARRRHRRVPLRALQREPEARADIRAELRRVLPQPAAGVRRRVRPRRQQGHRRGRPRVAGQRQEQRPGRRRRGEGGGDSWRCVVRGERDGGREAEGGAGLRVRARRRGLQGHPARRGVLRAQHHGLARLVRVQRLLPAQGPLHRHLRLRRRRLRRQPGTKDGQVRAPLHGLKQSNKEGQGMHLGTRKRMENICVLRSAIAVQGGKEGGMLESRLRFLTFFAWPLLDYCRMFAAA